MTERGRVLIRMSDVVLALAAAGEHSEQLGKLRLQKFIYLTDAVSLLYSQLPPQETHTTYMHGPYDSAIQRAVDALAFRGFVTIHRIRHNVAGVRADYSLNEAGIQLAKRLKEELKGQWDVFRDVAVQVDQIGWRYLRALAYAEPTFATARTYGYGQALEVADGLVNSSALILATMDRVLANDVAARRPSRELIGSLFFRYLKEYAANSKVEMEETETDRQGERE